MNFLNPHKDKLLSALSNKKAAADRDILKEALAAYNSWIEAMNNLTETGTARVAELVRLLNQYKDFLEVDLIAGRGSEFIKRQKGQMKLDNSVIEEFLPYLIDSRILHNLPSKFKLETGARTSFMSLAFSPSNIQTLETPQIILKEKDQDFTIGKSYYYKFSSDESFPVDTTICGKLFLAVLAIECKVNYDKTMFQECAGTAFRLKQGCPVSKYYAAVEYLDMIPEDTRLTSIDNVFLLRKAKRLPYEKRSVFAEIKAQHEEYPIALDVVLKIVSTIQEFIDATWYNPNEALIRGSFV